MEPSRTLPVCKLSGRWSGGLAKFTLNIRSLVSGGSRLNGICRNYYDSVAEKSRKEVENGRVEEMVGRKGKNCNNKRGRKEYTQQKFK